MTLRVCAEPGCPELSDKPRCPVHRSARERARGTRQARGYDAAHQRERDRWQRHMNRHGPVACRSLYCKQPGHLVDPADWQLGHTADRTAWTGPEDPGCNQATAAHRTVS